MKKLTFVACVLEEVAPISSSVFSHVVVKWSKKLRALRVDYKSSAVPVWNDAPIRPVTLESFHLREDALQRGMQLVDCWQQEVRDEWLRQHPLPNTEPAPADVTGST